MEPLSIQLYPADKPQRRCPKIIPSKRPGQRFFHPLPKRDKVKAMTYWKSLGLILALIAGREPLADETMCAAISGVDLSGLPDAPTQVVKSTFHPEQGMMPAHCRVEAVTAPHIGIEVRLPTARWNGKSLQQGCGGSCGQITIVTADDALSRGYAVSSTDQGHRGSMADAKWAYNDLSAEISAGYRATHITKVVTDALIDAFYGRVADYRYFRGCSNGGRQAMRSSQVFPDDFNGIIAGAAPPSNSATLNGLWGLFINRGADNEPILTADILPVVQTAALNACDDLDGLTDGIISDPRQCSFDPATLVCSRNQSENCVSQQQADVLKEIYDGPRNSSGQKLVVAGPPIGSELAWRAFIPNLGEGFYNSRRQRRIDTLRYSAFIVDPGPSYDFNEFDWDRDPPRMRGMTPVSEAVNPDLRKFKTAGGKLLMYIGTRDYIPTESMIDYYETAERIVGSRDETQDFFRLFVIPGMDHCQGGPGAGFIDYLSALDDWVANNQPPERLIGANVKYPDVVYGTTFPASSLPHEQLHRDPNLYAQSVNFTRPHFPYPNVARYSGSGDVNAAESFERVSSSP